jgi:myo-inositol 2-dehydrogenase/D-chiro-inositol 1-dehydrogenase
VSALRLGIVGCGRVTTRWHVPALRAVDGIEVAAAADTVPERRAAVAEALGARTAEDEAAILAADDIDAVAVCTPAHTHARIALAALDAGKDVFVEKPLCVAVEDAHAIERRVVETGRTLLVGFNLRHHRLVRRARALVERGALGEVVAVQSSFSSDFDYRDDAGEWRFDRALGGGAVFEMASHHVDLWRTLLADEVAEVFAYSSSERGEDDATAVVAARSGRGAAISFVVTQRSGHHNECVVLGKRGTLRLSPYRHDGLELVPAGSFPATPARRLRRAFESAAALRSGRAPFDASYAAEWRAFAAAVRGGPAVASAADGARNVEVLDAILRSAESGAPVRP